MHVICEERYGRNGILAKFVTSYPIPQIAEKFSECKYYNYNLHIYNLTNYILLCIIYDLYLFNSLIIIFSDFVAEEMN